MTPVRAFSGALLLALLGLACASPGQAAPAPRFVFRSSFWVNLHHFLRAEARRQGRGAELVQPLDSLAAPEREVWTAALDAYRPLAGRSLLFDQDLVRLHVALAGIDGEGELPPGLVGAELSRALNGAAPVFRARHWAARARTNYEWIARTRPAVERLGVRVTDALAAAHQRAWPAHPVLVGVTSETGPDLAYTTSAAPPGFCGLTAINPSVAPGSPEAIECVFHEAAHVLDATLVRWVEEESARQGVEPPDDLWHAMLFYTAGELSARALGRPGTYRADLEQGFAAYLPALDACWKPYLDGELPLADALCELVGRTAADERR
jgi:hypothetical protein